jgi:DtxR family Mn-dependent transcriptional regulator
MRNITELTEALEDYLEAIYRIIVKKNGVRVKDIAEALKVRNPSVTSALKSLEKRNLINYEPYGIISLTKAGLEVALRVTEKHRLFKYFFMNILGIDQATADATACRMEHIIPRPVYVRLLQFVKYLYTTDTCGADLMGGFNAFKATGNQDTDVPVSLDDYFEGTGFNLPEGTHERGHA